MGQGGENLPLLDEMLVHHMHPPPPNSSAFYKNYNTKRGSHAFVRSVWVELEFENFGFLGGRRTEVV